MCDRELTQLISTAKYYLDAAEALFVVVADDELDLTVTEAAKRWAHDRKPHRLCTLDTYSAHLASCATRLATIHEIHVGGMEKAWELAYPKDGHRKLVITEAAITLGIKQAFEILLRDNVGHGEVDPSPKARNKDKFRKAALEKITFRGIRTHLRRRY